jgi:hypothetical protein
MTIDLLTHAARNGELEVEPVLELMRGMKPPCRSLLGLACEATLTGTNMTVAEFATAMGRSEHETLGIINETRELLWGTVGNKFSLMATEKVDPNSGSIDWSKKKVVVYHDLANAVLAAEELLSEDDD